MEYTKKEREKNGIIGTEEVANMIGVSSRQVRRMVKSGKINPEYISDGGTNYFLIEEIQKRCNDIEEKILESEFDEKTKKILMMKRENCIRLYNSMKEMQEIIIDNLYLMDEIMDKN